MKHVIPQILGEAIASGIWKDPGRDALRLLLGNDLPDMKLYEEIAAMEHLAFQLNTAGYVDDRQFCMARGLSYRATPNEPRLAFERALFVGASMWPGDDVFLAIHLDNKDSDPSILYFDWNMPIPNRWVVRGTLGQLIDKLASLR